MNEFSFAFILIGATWILVSFLICDIIGISDKEVFKEKLLYIPLVYAPLLLVFIGVASIIVNSVFG